MTLLRTLPIAIRMAKWKTISSSSREALDLASTIDPIPLPSVCFALNIFGESVAISVGQVLPLNLIPIPEQAFLAKVFDGIAIIGNKRQAYIPIIDDSLDFVVVVVVGFGFMDDIQIANPTTFSFQKIVSRIASENASAIPFSSIPASIFPILTSIKQDRIDHLLLAPVLVR